LFGKKGYVVVVVVVVVLHLVQSSQEMYGINGFTESAPPRALEAC